MPEKKPAPGQGLFVASIFWLVFSTVSGGELHAQSITTPTTNTNYASTAAISVLGETGQPNSPFVIEIRFPGITGNILGTVSGVSLANKEFSTTVFPPMGGWTGPGGGPAGVLVLYCKDANGVNTTIVVPLRFF